MMVNFIVFVEGEKENREAFLGSGWKCFKKAVEGVIWAYNPVELNEDKGGLL